MEHKEIIETKNCSLKSAKNVYNIFLIAHNRYSFKIPVYISYTMTNSLAATIY